MHETQQQIIVRPPAELPSPCITKEHPTNIDATITPYQKVIRERGYDYKLTYNPEAKQTTRNKMQKK